MISSDLEPPFPDLEDFVQGDSAILTRGTGEAEMSLLAQALEKGLLAYAYRARGGADNWRRDVELVEDADRVIVVLSEEALANTEISGAWHVAERAIVAQRPLHLYVRSRSGLVEIASD